MPWTKDSLEQALRKCLLTRASLKVLQLPGKVAADVEWAGNGKAKVRVDDHETSVRAGVIHELLHVVLDDTLEPFDDYLAEDIVLALERTIDRRVALSPRRLAWWRKAINGKLPK